MCVGGLLLSAGIILASLAIAAAAALLLESRQALAVTLENISQGIAMIRTDGSVPVFNLRAIELLGLPPELMTGRPSAQATSSRGRSRNNEFGDASDP